MRRKRPKGDGEEHHLLRLVADGDDPRIGVRDATRLVLDLGDVVDDVLLCFVVECARLVRRTDDVHLIVLERQVALVDVDYMVSVVYPEAKWGPKREQCLALVKCSFLFVQHIICC